MVNHYNLNYENTLNVDSINIINIFILINIWTHDAAVISIESARQETKAQSLVNFYENISKLKPKLKHKTVPLLQIMVSKMTIDFYIFTAQMKY